MVWTPPHVDPANAGIHSDAANHDPARGDLVDRRIKCADDVGGGLGRSRNGGGAETGNVDYAMTGNRHPQDRRGGLRLSGRDALRSPGRRIRPGDALGRAMT